MTESYSTIQKEVLTTGEVAHICHVAPRTVSKWFDTGKLRGYRIPGSRDRRIPRQQLLAFMRAHGIPLDGLEESRCRVLIVDDNMDEKVRLRLQELDRYSVKVAQNRFEAGMLAQQFHPHVVILQTSTADDETAVICRSLKCTEGLEATAVVLTGDHGRPAQTSLFDDFLPCPYTLEQLVDAVERATNLIV